jgi:hypothetical protein
MQQETMFLSLDKTLLLHNELAQTSGTVAAAGAGGAGGTIDGGGDGDGDDGRNLVQVTLSVQQVWVRWDNEQVPVQVAGQERQQLHLVREEVKSNRSGSASARASASAGLGASGNSSAGGCWTSRNCHVVPTVQYRHGQELRVFHGRKWVRGVVERVDDADDSTGTGTGTGTEEKEGAEAAVAASVEAGAAEPGDEETDEVSSPKSVSALMSSPLPSPPSSYNNSALHRIRLPFWGVLPVDLNSLNHSPPLLCEVSPGTTLGTAQLSARHGTARPHPHYNKDMHTTYA